MGMVNQQKGVQQDTAYSAVVVNDHMYNCTVHARTQNVSLVLYVKNTTRYTTALFLPQIPPVKNHKIAITTQAHSIYGCATRPVDQPDSG